ncbi:hypothetical protein ACUHMQ_17540 [Chitinimonas sp. PSY-7]|uniref:hypothetical protein n=1 Tax=Chitinimonas sp. PSY-7 TaxID=3459088 RepID=UPI00403FE486
MRDLLLRLLGRQPAVPDWLAVMPGPEGWNFAQISRRDSRPLLYTYQTIDPDLLRAGRLGNQKGVVTLLGSQTYRLLQIETPNVPPEEMRTAVRWQVKPMLETHIDDVTIDVLDIPQPSKDTNRPALMLVVAANNDVVADCVNQFREMQVPLEAIDIPELALRNIASLFERPGHAVLLAWFGMEYGMLLVVRDGELYMVRNLESGAQKLIRDGPERDTHLDRIQREISRTVDHVDRYFRDLALSHLVLALPCDPTPLLEALRDHMDLPIEVADLANQMDGIAELIPDPQRQVEAMLLLGAALREGARAS